MGCLIDTSIFNRSHTYHLQLVMMLCYWNLLLICAFVLFYISLVINIKRRRKSRKYVTV